MRNPLEQLAMSQLGNLQRSLVEAAEEAQRELRNTKLEASSGGGAVRVTANGLGELIDVKLDPNVITAEEDQVALLEALIADAVRNVMELASQRAAQVRQEKLKASGPFAMLEQMGIDLSAFGT
ncbi:MAG: YbaB/EbfC family nucleoid-associated protein [Armatimonadetes bacterium]|nr:YbaB/EbfC family nucleoid-associated protein [Armatimonadota bacterium]